MDRVVVLSVLLLVGLTWLLYKLAVLLEPRGDKPAAPPIAGHSSQKLIHQRLRK
ncbi:hypothetical protein ACFPN2_35410 [Steroidobacter flavus]|uniref:Uncharacterized protein n=1 Tax=Steroidobacter flavus TaxID=1842136 RepID=A0ABV8T622_9GAMM